MPDDPLEAYRAKRDFRKTPEPGAGEGRRPSESPLFVVQKHQARALHYDFRLEVDGTLKSWAVPKGPSPDPSVRRLAMPTEDHPMEYANFEGAIPKGEYGAGAVIVWDRGAYRNLRGEKAAAEGRATMAKSCEEGMVEIWLEGEKMVGGYALVRTSQGRWLLIKMKDENAAPGHDLTVELPASVLTGRTLEEVAAAGPPPDGAPPA